MLGINLAGAEFGSVGGGAHGTNYIYPSNDSIDYYASKGMEVIRLPFLWERVQPTQNGPLDQSELSRIESIVDYAASKGMNVVLDVHNYGEAWGGLIGSDVPNSVFADFWGKMATHFKGDANVVFGLMNEPNQQSASQWIGSANAAIDAIRDAGATQHILVPGSYWDGAHSWVSSDNDTVVGNGVVDPLKNYSFEVHQYLDGNSSGTSASVVSPTIGVERLTEVTDWARSTGNKLFLGEFGAAQDGASLAALDNMLKYMEQNADVWSGATYWAGGPWWGDYMFSVEPDNIASPVDKPQLDLLEKYDLDPSTAVPGQVASPQPTEPTPPDATPPADDTTGSTPPVSDDPAPDDPAPDDPASDDTASDDPASDDTGTPSTPPTSDDPVQDPADPAPSEHVLQVDENSKVVTPLAASDPDGSEFGAVEFAITGGEDASLFELVDGKLQFKEAPDFEGEGDNSYQVTVAATQGSGPSSEQTFRVEVNNLDDEGDPEPTPPDATPPADDTTGSTPPVSDDPAPDDPAPDDPASDDTASDDTASDDTGTPSTPPTSDDPVQDPADPAPSEHVLQVDENSKVVTPLAASDPDGSEFGAVEFAITGGEDASLFELVDGKLQFKEAPDFEGEGDNSYQVTVAATQGSGPSSEQTFRVEVNNLNDEAPVWQRDYMSSLNTADYTPPTSVEQDNIALTNWHSSDLISA